MKVANYPRLFFSIGYLLVSVSILKFFHDRIFYLEPTEGYNFFRFLWCIACSFLGFSTLAFWLSATPPNPRFGPYISTIPNYIAYYPFVLVMVSCIGFSIFSAIKATNGYVFYYASFVTCVILGYLADYFWQIIGKAIERK